MPHSYTNCTIRAGSVVTKSYQGPEAARRCAHETAVLRGLAGRLPIPQVIDSSGGTLRLRFMPGIHGQDLIRASSALIRSSPSISWSRRSGTIGRRGGRPQRSMSISPSFASSWTVLGARRIRLSHVHPDTSCARDRTKSTSSSSFTLSTRAARWHGTGAAKRRRAVSSGRLSYGGARLPAEWRAALSSMHLRRGLWSPP